ncbi:hypothetical protein Tco_1459120 [Tanacetum coccineum]
MPPRRTRILIKDVYERIKQEWTALDQFCCSIFQSNERYDESREDVGIVTVEKAKTNSDDYEGAPVFDDGYEEAPIFDDDQFEEESMPVYDTDIEDVISEEEENMEVY